MDTATAPLVRHCNRCGLDKPRSEFYAEKNRPVLSSRCKECDRRRSADWNRCNPERHSENQRRHTRKPNSKTYQRRYLLMAKFGITPEQYDAMLASQDGKCAICSSDNPGGRGRYFHVDHDHSTGRIRGLLCHGCNTGIGLLRDDPSILSAALAYLHRGAL